jgi:hypothetical protein
MTLRKTPKSQSFLVIANVLTGILSIVLLGLVGHNLSYVRSSKAQDGFVSIVYNITEGGVTQQQSHEIAFLPEDVRLGSYWLMLAAGIGGLLDAVLLAFMLSWRKLSTWKTESEMGEVSAALMGQDWLFALNKEKKARDVNLYPQTPLIIFIAIISLCRSLAAAVYAFYEWTASGAFNPAGELPLVNGRYSSDGGIFFTPDAWNCQLEDHIPIEAQNNLLEMLCAEGTASRTVALALMVLSSVVLGCILWRAYHRRRRAKSQKDGRDYRTWQRDDSESKTIPAQEKKDNNSKQRPTEMASFSSELELGRLKHGG